MSSATLTLFEKKIPVTKLFWYFLSIHLLVWTIVPTLICPNAPLDVIEGYAWGREWLIGTYKHPPMQAWWLEFFENVTFRAPWGHFLASQLAIAISFWAVWRTGLRILGELPALLSVLLLEGVVYYNFTSPEFNPNVLQLPFWALIGLYYYRAVKDGKMLDWVLLGTWSACGLYSKYSTVLLMASLAILTFARPESRRRFKTLGPYVALVVAVILFLPHLVWLTHNDFLPLNYAHERMQNPESTSLLKSSVLIPALFIGSQILAVLPALLMFIMTLGSRAQSQQYKLTKFDKAFLSTVTFGPCFLVLVAAMLFGLNIHDMWAMPFWNFIGLWALAYFQPVLSAASLRRFGYSFAIIAVGILLAYVGGTVFYPYITLKAQRVQFPGHALAQKASGTWHDRFHTPLEYVIGDTWPAGNIAYYAPDRPHVFIRGETTTSPWIDPEMVAKHGGILVWCVQACSYGNHHEETPSFVASYPTAEMQTPLTLPRRTGANVPPVVIGWAILPPR